MIGYVALVLYALTIPAANWMIGNVGDCSHGPCVIPVGFGFYAPSGVLLIGLALVLRDVVHSILGLRWSLGAIALGAALSVTFAAPSLVAASVAAFVLSEMADLAVYAPLRKRRLLLAVLASGVVGAIVDSAVFLVIAFGSLEYIEGQIFGKIWATLAGGALLKMNDLLRQPQ